MNKKHKTKSRKLYIVYGGPSSEREVSFSSKDYFFELYKSQKPILVEWLEDFRFNVFCSRHPELDSGSHRVTNLEAKLHREKDFYQKLSKENCIVIIAGHGEYIEDGYIQEKLSSFGVAFTGSSAKSCRLAMDKFKSQTIASEFVKIIPTYKTLIKDFDYSLFSKKVSSFPVFVKPNDLGSSVGCYLVKSKEDLKYLLNEIKNEKLEYLFQKCVTGIELSVGTVRYKSGFLDLPPTEIRPKAGSFFSWDAKYKTGGSEEITPANLDTGINKKISDVANKIHDVLGLGYYSRSDFILTVAGELYYLETNSYPGMSRTSLLPQQLEFSKSVKTFKFGLLSSLVKR